MNFSDDPLAELLSDNSLDNDNFFDAPAGGSAKKLPKATKSKGKLEDLFGIKEESEPEALNTSATKLVHAKPTAASTPRIVKQKPSLSMDDAEDDDLGFDPKRPKSGGGARKNLFDDLLAAAEPKRNIFDDILNSGDATNSKRPATAKPSMSRQSTDTTTENSQARPKTAAGAGRRSSAQSANLNTDPLGLFGKDKETNVTVSGMSTPVSKKRGTADWLGLGAEMNATTAAVADEEQDDVVIGKTSKETTSTQDIQRMTESDEADPEPKVPAVARPAADTTTQKILMLNSLNLESSHNYSALQQQEAQLAIAAQMKNQERALLEMQLKQETQDRKFQELLQQQLQRQQQMEEHIKAQQERINVHLQLMMTEPIMPNAAARKEPERSDVQGEKTSPRNESPKDEGKEQQQLLLLETDAKRNLLEKQRLEELVTNMKINYEQEIEMIESSYKKQLKVLEHHLAAVEERLKLENGELKDYYTGKLEQLKNDYDLQISSLKQDHEDDLRQLRSSHEADLERIRQAKMLEQSALRDHGSYLETLRMASSDLQELREGMNTTKEREQQLEARERRLADAERRLKIDEEGADEEKRRLMELVSTLELQLNRLSKDTAEENWQMRQRMAGIESEKKAFELEKQFHREQMERDEKRIEELKTLQLAEIERLQLDVQQERIRLLVEQQKLEMQHKLHEQTDLDKERLELEAQLQVARDAIKRADEQRDRCHKQQRELEQRKRLMMDKENALNVKEDEVVQASTTYRLAMKRAQMAEHKAHEAEQLLNAKLQLISNRAHELSEKEAQLSQERMLLTQDRLSLQKLKQQIGQSKCALCKMGVEDVEFSQRMAGHSKGSHAVNALPSQPQAREGQPAMSSGDIVDRMLDENIEASYRRMYNLPSNNDLDYWTTVGLDDDSKKLALDNGNVLDIEELVIANLNIN